jgi:predicted nucleotidyltransferase component of viral defense system
MIPNAYITKWRENAPWGAEDQVEQDLILSRILIEIFSDPMLRKELAFRGGTALHKLFIKPPVRYSEDIDLVRTSVGPIGEIIHTIRNKLDDWLGMPSTRRGQDRFTLYYSFQSESKSSNKIRVKIEINTREHNNLFDLCYKKLVVDNPWFFGETNITTYNIEELIGTKLRAFYQRKKARDLFDLNLALKYFVDLNHIMQNLT